ncbi:MAG: rRNA maturation RNase YbeY [Microthrixaceae bacterium]|nr:rRNA maturation RNase YbeY [Microthrixaceae bacterium]
MFDPEPITVCMSDEQGDHRIEVDRWGKLVAAVLGAEGVEGPGEVSVMFVGRDAMAELNVLHMGADGPTDVLSFPLDAGDELGAGDERLVGDVVVCPAVAWLNAPDHAGSFEDELAVLLVHGCLHLVGYDHAEEGERARMWARERELIATHHGSLGADPWSVC